MNRLGDSASLYLRQHADNPVHWQPWDDAALAEARARDVPVLLSIGYSACHWCHVMAHESFEDDATAAVMNALFVNVKVDREERPDLDRVYQLAHQLLSGRGGGWPLTVFLEPRALVPFFAGTYFPPAPRHGLPAFPELLRRVREWFDRSRDEVGEVNRRLGEAILAVQQPGTPADPDPPALLQAAARQALDRFDPLHGGFGGAPKFPQAPLLAALPVLARHAPAVSRERLLERSLDHMARGGLRDQLDGGFFRYTVDGDWTIPHFEKMLYDNAQLLPLYAAFPGDPWFREVATGIVDWLRAALREPGGGFAASMDADAGGVEGAFHVWDRAELRELLPPQEYAAAGQAFGLDGPPNFEHRHWHLVRRGGQGTDPLLRAAEERMRAVRGGRVPPATDHKRLTAWNALCARGLARAGIALGREDWITDAVDCLGFIRREAWRGGRLHAVVADDGARLAAYLDDHAFTLQACLAVLEARWDDELFHFAGQLAEALLAQFQDHRHGGFFFTAADQPAPVGRLRVLQDDATPSGNGVAALALLGYGHLAGAPDCLAAVDRLLRSATTELSRHPLPHATLLAALEEWHAPTPQLVISGGDAAECAAWLQAARRWQRLAAYAVPPGAARWPGAVDRPPGHGGTRALLCLGTRCLPPANTLPALEALLESACRDAAEFG